MRNTQQQQQWHRRINQCPFVTKILLPFFNISRRDRVGINYLRELAAQVAKQSDLRTWPHSAQRWAGRDAQVRRDKDIIQQQPVDSPSEERTVPPAKTAREPEGGSDRLVEPATQQKPLTPFQTLTNNIVETPKMLTEMKSETRSEQDTMITPR